MEVFPKLTSFYNAIAGDTRIGASHISIYMALLQQWNLNGGSNPLKIERTTIMKAAKINARETYNKCIKNLQEYGYITYLPSLNQFTKSTVYLNQFEGVK